MQISKDVPRKRGHNRKKTSGSSSTTTKSSSSHLARCPSQLTPSALSKLDPMWPCYACRASRTKCSGGFPCARCSRLSICCLPNNWKREEPILEYVLTTHSPKPFAEMYLQAFERLFIAGKIRRDSALRTLKMWEFLSSLAGADVTLGVASHVQKRFNVSAIELEEPMRMLQDPPSHVRYQRLQQYQSSAASQARTQQLKETEIFKRENEGTRASRASLLMFVTNGSTMWAACNEFHAARLKEATELWDKALQRKLIWSYLMAPLYAPEDRRTYIDSIVEMIFGHEKLTKTMFFKMYDKDGSVKLCLHTARTIRLGPHTTGITFKIEIVPPSRHLTMNAGSNRATGRVRSTWTSAREDKGRHWVDGHQAPSTGLIPAGGKQDGTRLSTDVAWPGGGAAGRSEARAPASMCIPGVAAIPFTGASANFAAGMSGGASELPAGRPQAGELAHASQRKGVTEGLWPALDAPSFSARIASMSNADIEALFAGKKTNFNAARGRGGRGGGRIAGRGQRKSLQAVEREVSGEVHPPVSVPQSVNSNVKRRGNEGTKSQQDEKQGTHFLGQQPDSARDDATGHLHHELGSVGNVNQDLKGMLPDRSVAVEKGRESLPFVLNLSSRIPSPAYRDCCLSPLEPLHGSLTSDTCPQEPERRRVDETLVPQGLQDQDFFDEQGMPLVDTEKIDLPGPLSPSSLAFPAHLQSNTEHPAPSAPGYVEFSEYPLNMLQSQLAGEQQQAMHQLQHHEQASGVDDLIVNEKEVIDLFKDGDIETW